MRNKNYIKGIPQVCCQCGKPIVGHIKGYVDEDCVEIIPTYFKGEIYPKPLTDLAKSNSVRFYKGVMSTGRFGYFPKMLGLFN